LELVTLTAAVAIAGIAGVVRGITVGLKSVVIPGETPSTG